MKVKDVLKIIKFNVGTLDDITNKSSVGLFTNSQIVAQLKYALDKYAVFTKALEGILTEPLDPNTQLVGAPSDVIRSQGYRMIGVWLNLRIYLLDMSNLTRGWINFPYQDIQGIPRIVIPWQDTLTIFPRMQVGYSTTTLTANIDTTDTTIPVVSTAAFLVFNGYITIGEEKIRYQNRDATNFYNCERGVEGTTVASHLSADTVKMNNLWVFYFKRHFDIIVTPDNYITDAMLEREMEVVDEHMEVITDYASYKLLSKVDAVRADSLYKRDFDQWLEQAKMDIMKGRSKIKNTSILRDPYYFEAADLFPYS